MFRDRTSSLQTVGSVALTDLSPTKLIALTFDDGPSAVNTPVLLDGLAQRGVHVTFFLVGTMVEDSPELVCRMVEEGHQIGVHTYDHSATQGLTGLTEAQFRAQVDTTRALLFALTGETELALRPPYGFVDSGVLSWADSPIVLWSVDTEDWRDKDAARIARHIVEHAEDGAVVLLHDIFSTSVEGALLAIDTLMEEGYCFVTVDELLAAQRITPQNGAVYPTFSAFAASEGAR